MEVGKKRFLAQGVPRNPKIPKKLCPRGRSETLAGSCTKKRATQNPFKGCAPGSYTRTMMQFTLFVRPFSCVEHVCWYVCVCACVCVCMCVCVFEYLVGREYARLSDSYFIRNSLADVMHISYYEMVVLVSQVLAFTVQRSWQMVFRSYLMFFPSLIYNITIYQCVLLDIGRLNS